MSNAYYKGSKGSNSNTSKSQNYKKNGKKREKKYSKEDSASKDEKMDTSEYVGQGNDPAWYNKNARLVQDASKIPFSNQLGAKVVVDLGLPFVDLDGSYKDGPLPGIMAFHMISAPGIATQATDGVNIATAGLFQYIRKNLSTVATYAPADVMAVTMAIDEVYSMYANILRAFGIVNAYSAINLYYPDGLLTAGYGFDEAAINEFKKNLNAYRSWFNNLIFKASTLYLPTDFSVTKRHAWLYSNYFVDGNSAKAQLYIHRMMYYREFDEATYPTGSAVVVKETAVTMGALLMQFDSMIDSLRNSDSVLKIQADMRRAFETSSSWSLAYADEAYLTLPVSSDLVLEQLNNLTILPEIDEVRWSLSDFDVTQSVNKNILLFNPTFTLLKADMSDDDRAMLTYLLSDRVLNYFKDDVTIDDITEGTSNTVCFISGTADGPYSLAKCRVDLCVGAYMYSRDDLENPIALMQATGTVSEDVNLMISKYETFDWAPQIWIKTGSGILGAEYGFANDLQNYAVVDRGAIGRLHDNILCSMWSIPEIGGFQG